MLKTDVVVTIVWGLKDQAALSPEAFRYSIVHKIRHARIYVDALYLTAICLQKVKKFSVLGI